MSKYSVTMFVAVAGFALLAVPIEAALADKPSIPVTVVNPPTMPALTSSVDDPGRIAYQSSQSPDCNAVQICNVTFPSVPANHRLVIQHGSGVLFVDSNSTNLNVKVSGAANGAVSGFVVSFPFPTTVGFTFDQTILLYFDAGASPSVELGSSSGLIFKPTTINLVGYLLDCTVSPCAPIAH